MLFKAGGAVIMPHHV